MDKDEDACPSNAAAEGALRNGDFSPPIEEAVIQISHGSNISDAARVGGASVRAERNRPARREVEFVITAEMWEKLGPMDPEVQDKIEEGTVLVASVPEQSLDPNGKGNREST